MLGGAAVGRVDCVIVEGVTCTVASVSMCRKQQSTWMVVMRRKFVAKIGIGMVGRWSR